MKKAKNEFQRLWKQSADNKQLISSDMALLSLVKAINKDNPIQAAKRYLKQNFKPITNARKLANGQYPNMALYTALNQVIYNHKFGWLLEEDQEKVKVLIQQIQGRSYGRVNLDE